MHKLLQIESPVFIPIVFLKRLYNFFLSTDITQNPHQILHIDPTFPVLVKKVKHLFVSGEAGFW